jgi:hypothetical protein
MKWSTLFPRWARFSMAGFGLLGLFAGVVSAASRSTPSDLLPAVIVGGTWLIVGLKGGLPLVQTRAGDLQSGIQAIRRRILIAYFAVLPWAALVAGIMLAVPERLRGSAFLLAALPLVALFGWAFLAECPRCGHHLFVSLKFRNWFWFWRCENCGLRLGKNPQPPGA